MKQAGKETSEEKAPAKPAAAGQSEAAYVARQADEAMRAMTRTVASMKEQLAEGVNPAEWAKKYPWLTLGTSALAGFAAVAALVSSKEERALNRLARLEKALNPKSHEAGNGDGDGTHKGGVRHSFATLLVKELIGTVRPALITILTAGVTGKKPSEDDKIAGDEKAADETTQAEGP